MMELMLRFAFRALDLAQVGTSQRCPSQRRQRSHPSVSVLSCWFVCASRFLWQAKHANVGGLWTTKERTRCLVNTDPNSRRRTCAARNGVTLQLCRSWRRAVDARLTRQRLCLQSSSKRGLCRTSELGSPSTEEQIALHSAAATSDKTGLWSSRDYAHTKPPNCSNALRPTLGTDRASNAQHHGWPRRVGGPPRLWEVRLPEELTPTSCPRPPGHHQTRADHLRPPRSCVCLLATH